MKIVFAVLFVFCLFPLSAQDSEQEAIKKTIMAFFEGFHRQDSVMIKETVDQNIILQTIGTDSLGKMKCKHGSIFRFFEIDCGHPQNHPVPGGDPKFFHTGRRPHGQRLDAL